MWREMSEVDKQHYNDDFVHDKVIEFSILLLYIFLSFIVAVVLLTVSIKLK